MSRASCLSNSFNLSVESLNIIISYSRNKVLLRANISCQVQLIILYSIITTVVTLQIITNLNCPYNRYKQPQPANDQEKLKKDGKTT